MVEDVSTPRVEAARPAVGPAPSRWWRRPAAAAAAGITLVAVLPVILVFVRYAGDNGVLSGDFALIDLRVRDVFSTNVPLLGMYSRFGWYHPGPAMFWSIAPFSLLTGQAAWATLVGAALLQGAAVVWSARLSWRRGGLLLLLAVLAVYGLAYAGISEYLPLQRPWNPFVAFALLPLFVLMAWSAGLGDVRQLPWLLLVGSLLVQTHNGYTVIVAAGVVWALALLVRHRRDAEVRHHLRRAGWLSAAVLAAVWIVPVVEQLRHGRDGNLVRLGRFFVLGDDSRVAAWVFGSEPAGLKTAAQVFAAEFRWVPPWLGGENLGEALREAFARSAAPVSLLFLLVPLAFIVAGLTVAGRARHRAAVHAVALSTLLAVFGVVSLSRATGALTDFVFYWRVSLAVILVVACAGAVLTSSSLWQHRIVRGTTAAVLAIAVVVSSFSMSRRVLDGDPALRVSTTIVEMLVDQLDAPRARRGPVELLTNELGVSIGVFNELKRRGRPVYASPTLSEHYLEGKHQAPRPVDEVWYLVAGPDVSRLAGLPHARELASTTPFTRRDELRVRRIQVQLSEQLAAAERLDLRPALESLDAVEQLAPVPGVDQELVAELVEARENLEMSWQRYGVFAFPRGALPEILVL